jgi:hypothetical protein
MDFATMIGSRLAAADTISVVSYFPISPYGLLPVNAFLLRAAQPVLVDTGLSALRDSFLKQLRSAIDLKDLRWIWLTHTDADHMGNLLPILAEAPNARVVTTFLGMGKMALQQLPLDRVYLLNPGQELDVGDRKLLCVKPPSFDAPETTGIVDSRTRVFFSADCFGALMKKPAETAADISPEDLREGVVTWTTIDAPWLEMADRGQWNLSLHRVRSLEPSVILSSHLPPAAGITETLLKHLVAAGSATPFKGPDQTALESLMKGSGSG